jgi:hypothetical protein
MCPLSFKVQYRSHYLMTVFPEMTSREYSPYRRVAKQNFMPENFVTHCWFVYLSLLTTAQ